MLRFKSAWLIEGALRRRSRGGAGCGVPRRRLVTAGPGGPEIRSRRHYDRGCKELAARVSEAMPKPEARNRDRKSPRWSAERRASLQPKSDLSDFGHSKSDELG